MDNRKKNFVYMTEFFFFFIWKMLYCGEMTGGKSMNKKGCNLKKILIGVSVGVMILASVVGVYLYVNRFDASNPCIVASRFFSNTAFASFSDTSATS